MNEMTIVGRIGQDPVSRTTGRGDAMLTFSVANAQRVRDTEGNWADGPTNWWDVVAYGSLAQHAERSLKKGTRVLVTGVVQQRVWQGQDGQKRKSTQVRADAIGPDLRFVDVAVAEPTSRVEPAPAAAAAGPVDEAGWAKPMGDVAAAASDPGDGFLPEPAEDEPAWASVA